jgi:hypothetical protein
METMACEPATSDEASAGMRRHRRNGEAMLGLVPASSTRMKFSKHKDDLSVW